MEDSYPVEENEKDDWEEAHPDRIGRMPYALIRQAKLDLFVHSDILDERPFDETFTEHKLPNVYRRTAEQTVTVTSIFLEYDDPRAPDFHVTCKIADPIDAAILLNSKENDVILQALEALIAFVEDRLNQFKNEVQDDAPAAPEVTDKKPGKKMDDPVEIASKKNDDVVEGDEYYKLTLINYPGFLRRVVQLTGSTYKSIRRRAVILLGSLSEVEEAIEKFEHIPWLHKLSHLIRTGTEPVVLDWAVLALKNFSILRNVQTEVLRKSMLEPLLDLVTLDNQDPDVVENTLQILSNLCANKHIREYLALNGGFEAANELVLSEFPSTQHYALRLMRDLINCPVAGVLDRFHEADGIATIISVLNVSELKFLHANTLEILEFLMGVPSIAQELSQKRIYEFLLDLALSKEYQGVEDVQAFTLRALSKAATFADQRLVMNNCDVERRVLLLLNLPSFTIQTAALQAVGNLGKTLNCRRRLRELHAIPVISKHLASSDPRVREQAFFAAGSLMLYESSFVEAFLKEDFLRLLHASLTDMRLLQTVGLIDQALSCVINLSETTSLRDAMCSFVVKHVPVWLSQPDESVKIKGLICAGIFIQDDHDKETFTKYGGYLALGSLLEPPVTDNLIRHVCWAISMLAVHRPAILAIAKSGCVFPLLEARRASNPTTSGYADLALRRLACLHLSFKYALFSELGPEDRIQHGFYDTGKIRGRMNFWSLKGHIRSASLSASPVIFVSLPRKRFLDIGQQLDKSADMARSTDLSELVVPGTADLSSKPSKTKVHPGEREKDAASPPPSRTSPKKKRKKSKARKKTQTPELDAKDSLPGVPRLPSISKEVNKPVCRKVVPKDAKLLELIRKVLTDIKIVSTIRNEIDVIACAVQKQMGGPDKLSADAVKNHLEEMMEKKQSSCIPLGDIDSGTFCHRALLFKVLADRIHMPVSLIRGHGGRGWNEVHLLEDGATNVYIVDLFQAGKLHLKDTPEALAYTEWIPPLQTNKQFQPKNYAGESASLQPGYNGDACGFAGSVPGAQKPPPSTGQNKLIVTGSAISIQSQNASPLMVDGRLRRSMNTKSFTCANALPVRKMILEDMENARELLSQKNGSGTVHVPTEGREKERSAPFIPAEVIPRDTRIETRAPLRKWRPKSNHDKDVRYLASIPRQFPSVIHAVPPSMNTKHENQRKKVSKEKLSWDPLISQSSLNKSDIWNSAPQRKITNALVSSSKPSVDEVLATADAGEVPDGYDPVQNQWEEFTADEQNLLERWEMDLEDDAGDNQLDNSDEAEDLGTPEDDKLHPPH